jgi:acyl-CoA thioester hydrolase
MDAFIHRRQVEFHETDLAGIVHFSNIFKWMEAAEHAFLRSLGVEVHARSAPGPGWPRAHASCDYKAPLRFEDAVAVELVVARVGRTSVTYDLVVRREADAVECARGRLTTVHVTMLPDGSMRSSPVPDALVQAAGGPQREA